MKKALLFRLAVLVTAMMCALGAAAAEAYACYTPSNTTLTFYYDTQRSSRTGTTYDLNTLNYSPGWYTDGTYSNVSEVKFDPSFTNARPTTCHSWFRDMAQLQTIYGLNYMNTSAVTHMVSMFRGCSSLTALDLTSFNTANVIAMGGMFMGCSNLRTIYAGSGWSTAAVEASAAMFSNCTSLVGGQGTAYNSSNPKDKTYAHIDGGPSNPGYFTEKGPEAYACYTSSNTTLTFYYDNQRSSRTGTTYNLNTGTNYPAWYSDGTNANVTKVVFNSSFSNARPTTTRYWFDAMANLQSITGMQYLNTSSVREMFAMFRGCSSLTSVDVSGFNTANVTNMYAMFRNCSSLTSVDLGNFNTANVTDMCAMFYGCSAMTSLNVSNFNTAKVTNMNTMFRDCSSLTSLDLSSFNTASVTNMGWMFMSCYNLASLDMSSFNTANVTNMSGMFYSCNKLTSLDLSNFNTAKVTNMNQMFYACSGLTSLDVSSFNTASVTSMGTMFYGCRNLTTIYAGSGWSTNAVTSSTDMFKNCTNLVGGKGTTYDANHIDKAYAHIDGGTSNPGYFTAKGPEAYACYTSSNTTLTFYYDNQRSSRTGTTYDLNTDVNFTDWHNDGTNYYVTQVVFDPSFANARPTSTSDWFDSMTNLESITGMNYLNTSEVTSMAWMFLGCRKLTSLDVSHFNTSKVIYMTQMFYRCIGLTSLDLCSFNTSKVIDMQSMFEESNKLQTIYVGNDWNTDAVAYSDNMFKNCTNLVGGKGTTYDANYIDKAYAHIDGGTSNPGYFTAKNAGLRGDVNGDNNVNISDVTTLIDYLLSGNASGISLSGADCNQDGSINISDVTALIDYLLSGHW